MCVCVCVERENLESRQDRESCQSSWLLYCVGAIHWPKPIRFEHNEMCLIYWKDWFSFQVRNLERMVECVFRNDGSWHTRPQVNQDRVTASAGTTTRITRRQNISSRDFLSRSACHLINTPHTGFCVPGKWSFLISNRDTSFFICFSFFFYFWLILFVCVELWLVSQ